MTANLLKYDTYIRPIKNIFFLLRFTVINSFLIASLRIKDSYYNSFEFRVLTQGVPELNDSIFVRYPSLLPPFLPLKKYFQPSETIERETIDDTG